MSSELKIDELMDESCIKIVISGEVDIFTSQKLKERLYYNIDEYRKDLKLECSGLNYIDSTGLGIFVGTLKKAKQYDSNIYLGGLKENIKKLFVITGLDKLFIIE